MSQTVDSEKVRKIFKQITEGDIDPLDYEDLFATLSQAELLLLREMAVEARCASITAQAKGGLVAMAQKPN